ncbi:TlpA family protein disulfide reductase [Flagellimonas zhangzhouensis]|nr:TlpA disulfide reductase family protein [Allomuricauda zhangzhouensis]
MKILLRGCLLLLAVLQSCSEAPWLSGHIQIDKEGEWKPMLYVVKPLKLSEVGQSFVAQVLDSAEVDADGNFEFESTLPYLEPTLLQLVIQKQGEKYPNKLSNENPETDNYVPLIYEPGIAIVLNTEDSKFQGSFALENPSELNKALMDLRDIRLEGYAQLQSKLKTLSGDKNLLEREKAVHNYQTKIMEFANITDDVLPSLMAFRWVNDSGDYEHIPEFVTELAEKWNATDSENVWVQELNTMAEKSNLPILIGDKAPELLFPMQNGSQLSLADLLKENKLVLLDAWASWCAPCRVENRNVLVPLWENYHNKGFQIMAYGLESSEQAWENAIERDGAHRWLNASHLTGDQNAFMDALRIRTIPANFLLDKNGKVLAKNLHGAELTQFVQEYFK